MIFINGNKKESYVGYKKTAYSNVSATPVLSQKQSQLVKVNEIYVPLLAKRTIIILSIEK